MTRRARFADWLTEPVNKVMFLVLCAAVGLLLGVAVWGYFEDTQRAREQREANTRANHRQDLADRNLREAIRRLEALEHPTRADIERLIRSLGARGSRRVLEQLLRSATPEQLRRIAEGMRQPSPEPPPPRTPTSPQPNRPAPLPPPAEPRPPTVPEVPSPPNPGDSQSVDVPPFDVDGDGPIPPIDLPPVPLPQLPLPG